MQLLVPTLVDTLLTLVEVTAATKPTLVHLRGKASQLQAKPELINEFNHLITCLFSIVSLVGMQPRVPPFG